MGLSEEPQSPIPSANDEKIRGLNEHIDKTLRLRIKNPQK